MSLNLNPERAARLALLALARNREELCVTSQNIAEFWNVCAGR